MPRQAWPATKSPAEFATFKAASLFVERVAFACPPQHELRHFKIPCVVEFRDGPRPLAASTGAGARIRATADSAMVSLGLDEDGWYERDSTQYAALVAARKRFGDVKGKDGLPVLTDSLLGQLTCEALALRLSLAQADGREGLDENQPPSTPVVYLTLANRCDLAVSFTSWPHGNTCASFSSKSPMRTSQSWSPRRVRGA
jgi:hypothetical protein